MLYYQCTIIIIIFILIAKTKTKSNFIKKLIIYDTLHIICLRALSQTQQWKARTILKTSTDNHFSSCHSHIKYSGLAKPDIISTWWAFYFMMLVYEWLKGLITLAIALYVSDKLIGSFLANTEHSVKCPAYPCTFLSLWPFYFAIILTTQHLLCTL